MENGRRKFVANSAIPLAMGLALSSKDSHAQSASSGLPGLTIELGHSQQPNNGRGIDYGNYYQVDCRIGARPFNGFSYTANTDGTITLGQNGVYQAYGYAHIISPDGSDTFQIPAQVMLAIGMNYAWPGVYQYAVQSWPSPAVSTQGASNLGSISLTGTTLGWGAGVPLWLGYSKVAETQNNQTRCLQGTITILKLA